MKLYLREKVNKFFCSSIKIELKGKGYLGLYLASDYFGQLHTIIVKYN